MPYETADMTVFESFHTVGAKLIQQNQFRQWHRRAELQIVQNSKKHRL